MAASTEMFVAFRSSRVLMTVPSRISRTMSSSVKSRAIQASQSTFTLRQARLTTMSHVAPMLRATSANAHRALKQPIQRVWQAYAAPLGPRSCLTTRRVLVPAR